MTERNAQTIVVIVGSILFAYTGLRKLLSPGERPGDTYRKLWAIAGVTLLLTFLADVAPQIAAPFAILVAIAYITAGKGVSDLLAATTATPAIVRSPVLGAIPGAGGELRPPTGR